MKMTIAETLDKQAEIIKLQTELINRLSVELLQYGMMEDEELKAIQNAAMMQEKISR